MDPYHRLKKHRQLKRFAKNTTPSYNLSVTATTNSDFVVDANLEVNHINHVSTQYSTNSITIGQYNEINSYYNDFDDTAEHSDSFLDVTNTSLEFSSIGNDSLTSFWSLLKTDESSLEEYNIGALGIREKLQSWAVRFRQNLTVETIDSLLNILRSENIPNLPKSAVTLLQTKTSKSIRSMRSLKNTFGSYVYFGLEEGLKNIVTNDFTENTIKLLFNIDGLPLFNNSSQQFWTNLGLIVHNDYESQPFIVAV